MEPLIIKVAEVEHGAQLQSVVMALVMAKKYRRHWVAINVESDFVNAVVNKRPKMVEWAEQADLDCNVKSYVKELEHLMEWMNVDWNFGQFLFCSCAVFKTWLIGTRLYSRRHILT